MHLGTFHVFDEAMNDTSDAILFGNIVYYILVFRLSQGSVPTWTRRGGWDSYVLVRVRVSLIPKSNSENRINIQWFWRSCIQKQVGSFLTVYIAQNK